MLSTHIRDIWATQRTATEIFVEHSTGRSTLLQSDGTAVSGICINERHFILASNKRITVYKITRTEEYPNAKTKSLQIKATGANFHDNDCIEVFIWDETIIVLGNTEIRFYSLSGVILRKIELNDNEGIYIIQKIVVSSRKHNMEIYLFKNRQTDWCEFNTPFSYDIYDAWIYYCV